METKPKRPPSVWIAQILLLVYVLVFLLVGFVMFVSVNAPTALVLIIPVIFLLVFLSVFVAAFIGLAYRKAWGRWLTVGLLSLNGVSSAVSQFLQGTGGGSSAYKSGYVFGSFVVIFLFGYLIYLLAMGDAASDFFNYREPEPEPGAVPPPPPTFDS